jgi:hypothetical protein
MYVHIFVFLLQLSEVGFEMIIYSFGSDFNLESNSTAYLDALKADVAYANAKGIEVGGYDLIALTRKVQVNKHLSSIY